MAINKEDIVKELSDKDLKDFLETIKKEIEQRKANRFEELTEEIIKLLKQLKKEFPYACIEIDAERDDDYGTMTVDIMNYIEDIYVSM